MCDSSSKSKENKIIKPYDASEGLQWPRPVRLRMEGSIALDKASARQGTAVTMLIVMMPSSVPTGESQVANTLTQWLSQDVEQGKSCCHPFPGWHGIGFMKYMQLIYSSIWW